MPSPALLMLSVPALRVTPPVKELLPLSVNAPAPSLVSDAPAPIRFTLKVASVVVVTLVVPSDGQQERMDTSGTGTFDVPQA